jgi:2-methylcitrate dehydratase
LQLPFDRAAQFYTALIRYPDFMDNYMGKEATCHPSDNIGSLLAACWHRRISGKEFLTAMAIAYEIECRLVEEIPVMIEGIDHTLFLAYSITGALSRLFRLTKEQTAQALAMAGCSISPMVTSRASYTSEWKGLASSLEALDCMNIVLLAKQGMTGPVALFEGPKGFEEIFNMKLDFDWSKDKFELLQHCVLKEYNAEVHSQSSLEAAIALRNKWNLKPGVIEKVVVTTFLTAYHIIGSGAYGDRKEVETKEQADHSLFYLIAVALIDGEVYPEQLTPERIKKRDVQQLLQKVTVKTGFPLHKPMKVAGFLDPYTESYPEKMKTKVSVHLKNGKIISEFREDYHGFHSRPFTWDNTSEKFIKLTKQAISPKRQQQIIQQVEQLEDIPDMRNLLKLITG